MDEAFHFDDIPSGYDQQSSFRSLQPGPVLELGHVFRVRLLWKVKPTTEPRQNPSGLSWFVVVNDQPRPCVWVAFMHHLTLVKKAAALGMGIDIQKGGVNRTAVGQGDDAFFPRGDNHDDGVYKGVQTGRIAAPLVFRGTFLHILGKLRMVKKILKPPRWLVQAGMFQSEDQNNRRITI